MQRPIIVANWKAYLSVEAVNRWMELFMKEAPDLSQYTCILAPSFPFLLPLRDQLRQANLPILLASQDVSAYDLGAVTGEVAAEVLKDLVTYTIIGHSERRMLFHETDMTVTLKARQTLTHALTPIVCVPDISTPIPDGVRIVAYEPVAAIGTGNADTPENANAVAHELKSRGVTTVLYGGSVTPDNVYKFTSQTALDGVLVGKASLDPEAFITLLKHA